MKIWVKLLIFGVILFFAGAFIISGYWGINTPAGSGGMIISFIGFIIIVVAILAALTRGFNRMMRE